MGRSSAGSQCEDRFRAVLRSLTHAAAARRWDEDFELLVHDPEHQSVNVVIMNRSTFGPDEVVGRVSVRSLSA